MVYTDYLFFPFFLAAVLLYFGLPLKVRWIGLLAASMFFFFTWGVELLPFAVGAVVVAWAASCLMKREYLKQDERILREKAWDAAKKAAFRRKVKQRCRYLLWAAVTLIVGMLVYIKAQHMLAGVPVLTSAVWFFSKVYQHIGRFFMLHMPVLGIFVKDTGVMETFTEFSFFVPLGISYYTMSLVGYLADVYWRKEEAEKNILLLLLYALYFPKILAGPIVKYRDCAPMLREGHPFAYQRMCEGLQRMLWGYVKKMVIADRLNLFVSPVFAAYEDYHGAVLLVAAVGSVFYTFCDFSGCMDIALGASQVFGVELTENFKRPFFSVSVSEYWRRWHMTLGIWFKDYVYMPLAVSPRLIRLSGKLRDRFGKRAGKNCMTVVPLCVVWLLTGLWHSTGWNYIVWGSYWGSLIILSTIFEPEITRLSGLFHIPVHSRGFQAVRMLRLFMLVIVSRILTEPGSLAASAEILKKIVFQFYPWELFDGTLYTLGLDRPGLHLAAISVCMLGIIGWKQEKGIVFRDKIAGLPIVLRWSVLLAGIAAVLVFGIYGTGYDAGSFLYMNY